MKRKISYAFLIFITCVLAACATTMKQKYAIATDTFVSDVQLYNQKYDAAPLETQKQWKEKVDPYILKANDALKAWKMAIGTSEATLKEQLWKTNLNELVAILVNLKILQIGD